MESKTPSVPPEHPSNAYPSHTEGVVVADVEEGDDGKSDDDNEAYVQDQLPSVEEVRTQAASHLSQANQVHRISRRLMRPSRDVLKIIFIIGSSLLLISIVVLAVGLTRPSRGGVKLNRDDVIDFLVLNGYASKDEMFDKYSAQTMAVNWLVEKDGRGAEPLPATNGPESISFLQRYSLVVLYFSTEGDNWTNKWNIMEPNLHTCEWNREARDDRDDIMLGATCFGDVVQRLRIPFSGLKGSVPRELSFITTLTFVQLHHNEFTGTLPESLQLLTNVDYFAMHYNRLVGTIPDWFHNLSALRVLGLGNNVFTGRIPTSLRSLTNLVTLGLDDNMLTGNLENLQDLKNMKRLYLNDNGFTGSLDNVFLLAMRDLEELDLSLNDFGGTLPIDYFDFQKLQILDLNTNRLSGDLPLGQYSNPSLTYVALNYNEFTGPIIETIGNLTNLSHLDLAGNDFTGFIPTSITTGLTDLQYLYMADLPSLTADAVPDLSKLTNLVDLSLKNTKRTGTIPNLCPTLVNLTLLDLDNNALAGQLPTSLARCNKLQYLFLNRNNNVTGNVPTEIQGLPTLKVLLLTRTSVTGNLGPLCNRESSIDSMSAITASADCRGDTPEIECTCCSICCSDDQPDTSALDTTDPSETCQNTVYYGEISPEWENSFFRKGYDFQPRPEN